MAVRFSKYILLILLFSSGRLWSQPLRQFISYGDDAFRRGEYYNAAAYYSQGLEKFESNLELKFKYAEASRMTNDYTTANEFYKQVALDDEKHQFPTAVFWLGTMQKFLGKYDYAIVQFRKYKMHAAAADSLAEKATREMESCKWAKEHLKDSVKHDVQHLDRDINSEYTEFNPIENREGRLQFSSLRNISSDTLHPQFLSRLYVSPPPVTPVTMPVPNDKHVANAAYRNDGSRLFFSECVMSISGKMMCEIYSSIKKEGRWLEPEKLNATINTGLYTVTQPDYSLKKNGDRFLYFVSDRPGGFGKLDIWYSREVNGVFETPVNAGKEINTPDDDISPFFDAEADRLYFSSEGHVGFGGLDVFYSNETNNTFGPAVNMGASVNSSCNDFDFYINPDRSKVYFASNRKGAFYLKSETCCNDIWMFATGNAPQPPIAVATPAPPPTLTDSVVPKKIDTISPRAPTITASVPLLADSTYFDVRLKKMRQLLPVTLYFHNDEPECCNLRDTTALNYVTTYQDYWKRLNEYKTEFSKGLQQNEKTAAEQAVFTLFTNRVEKGYYDLIRFSRLLWEVLEAGGQVQLHIQGYCSPLNYNAYNIQLGYRRVASLRNYIYQYRNGLFQPFIRNGQLILNNESFGEETAAKDVSDQREDTRNSVYNPEAAKERKVQIISVELKGSE